VRPTPQRQRHRPWSRQSHLQRRRIFLRSTGPRPPPRRPGVDGAWSISPSAWPSLALIALVGAIFRGSGGDAYDVAANDFGRQLLAMPDFKAKYGELTTEQQAYAVGQKAAASGIPRLGDADLLRYWQDSAKLLNVAEPGACGRILRNKIQPGEASKVARALDIETFKDLLGVTLLAVEADLRGDPVRPVPDAQQVSGALVNLQSAMGPSMLESSSKLTDASATDADVCTAGRTFIGGVLALGEPDRTVILRYSISNATP
jgi:hypothetical protein